MRDQDGGGSRGKGRKCVQMGKWVEDEIDSLSSEDQLGQLGVLCLLVSQLKSIYRVVK